MQTPTYFVQPSASEEDMAVFVDRETGNQDVTVNVKQDADGATDAIHTLCLTIDIDVPMGAYVVVNTRGLGTMEGGVS